ncbi:MAG: type II toxin-antitoxin system RelE/ParE family toxin [Armatimonadetes bacterium]|nr:type II toxin-antitoxin system RelE/ParE family toxin [Armatimonadota bacterium]
MAREIVWTQHALSDLEQAAAYLEQRNPEAARRLVQTLWEAADGLVELPFKGHRLNELRSMPFLELVRGHYRMVYQVHETQVEILAVFHTRQPFEILRERLTED